MRWLLFALLTLSLGCAAHPGAVRSVGREPARDPVVADAERVEALSLDLEQQEVLDCAEAERLRDQICILADRICAIAEREPPRTDLCRDSRDRCERARARVEERCSAVLDH